MTQCSSTSNIRHKYNNLRGFLSNHYVNKQNQDGDKQSPTHTSMKGGSYNIQNDDVEDFVDLYFKNVFVDKNQENITEKQLETGPILIDFDFRYKGIVDRQHTEDHINDICYEYLEEIKKIVDFDKDTGESFPIYVMEKPKSNPIQNDNITKDGIHILIGLSMSRPYQILLRKNIMTQIDGILEDLPLTNTVDKILDEGISKGTTNWTLYGSNKPNHDAYKLTSHIDVSVDTHGEFVVKHKDVKKFDINKDFKKLMARYDKWNACKIKPSIESDVSKLITNNKSSTNKHTNCITQSPSFDQLPNITDIVDDESLITAVQSMLDSLKSTEYYIKETHEYTQALPSKYYEPGSHELSRKVAFALKHTDQRLFLSWVMLRSKAGDFDYDTVPDLYYKWNKHFNVGDKCITRRSIIYWVKQDAVDKYKEIKESMLDHFVDISIVSGTEFDFAIVLYQLYRDKYVCSNIQQKDWYVFENHKWERDEGCRLRLSISKEMYELYQSKLDDHVETMSSMQQDDAKYESMKAHGQHLIKVCKRLKKTSDKNNIMCEAKELFYDRHFLEKMDANKYLMCFSNGVIDFKTKEFRDGKPTDYITRCTNIPYLTPDFEGITEKQIEYIHTFMNQLFPIPSLCRYMWDHLAACLIGAKKEHAFNIYRGSGSNGKSMLTELMKIALGSYQGVLPVNYVIDKRKQIGSTSSEIVQLKGVRYVVMEEASKDSVMNEGVMKDVTGGGPMQGRALFHENETFTPQFNLVVCTNSLFEVKSDDDGTWRRIKLVDFMSKFIGKGESDIHNEKSDYTFERDKDLGDKLESMAPIFASMLVSRAFITNGEVIDCESVIEASRKYRREQDILSCYIIDNVIEEVGQTVGSRELHETFRLWHNDIYSGRKVPKLTELDDLMTKKFGRNQRSGRWKNVKIKYEKVKKIGEDGEEEGGGDDGDEFDEDCDAHEEVNNELNNREDISVDSNTSNNDS